MAGWEPLPLRDHAFPRHTCACRLSIAEAPNELRKNVDGCRRIASRCPLLFSALRRDLSPLGGRGIVFLNRIPIVEDLPCPGVEIRTKLSKLPLAFVPIEGRVLFLVVEDSPELETGVGNRHPNIVSTRQINRLVESRMDIPIEHRPYGIPSCESLALQLLRLFDCPFDHRSWIASDTNRHHPYAMMSVETVEQLEILRFGQHSFRGHHDSDCQRAVRMSARNSPRTTHDSAGISPASKSM